MRYFIRGYLFHKVNGKIFLSSSLARKYAHSQDSVIWLAYRLFIGYRTVFIRTACQVAQPVIKNPDFEIKTWLGDAEL